MEKEPGPSVVWSPELKKALQSWWDASLARVDASNHLCEPGKKQVARKRIGTLCEALTKSAFAGYAVSKEALVEQVKLLEEETRDQRRAAKAAKKRERDEARAVLAATPGSGNGASGKSAKKSVLSQLASLVKSGSAGAPVSAGGGGGDSGAKTSSKLSVPFSISGKPRDAVEPSGNSLVAASAAAAAAAAVAARTSKGAGWKGKGAKGVTAGHVKKAVAKKSRHVPKDDGAGGLGTKAAPVPRPAGLYGIGSAGASGSSVPTLSKPTVAGRNPSEKKLGKAVKPPKLAPTSGDGAARQISFAVGAPRPKPPAKMQDAPAVLPPPSDRASGGLPTVKATSLEAAAKATTAQPGVQPPVASTNNYEVIELD